METRNSNIWQYERTGKERILMIEAISIVRNRKEEIVRQMDSISKMVENQKTLGLKPIKKLEEVYDELWRRLVPLEQATHVLQEYMLKDDPTIKEMERDNR